MTMPAHQSGSSAGWVIMPKRRGRELIRGRFVHGSILTRRNLEFHDRELWRHNHGFKKSIAELTSVFGLRLRILLLECRS